MSTNRRLPPLQAGFTLVEMIIVIVLTAIIFGMIGTFLHWPIVGYFDSARRARLLDTADTALRRVAREVRTALPNSVRVVASGSNTYLEFIPTVGGGRYRAFPSGSGGGNILNFNGADNSFDVLGPVPVYSSGQWVAIYNLGPGSYADAYAGSNRAAVTSSNATMPGAPATYSTDTAPHTVTLAAATLFPLPSPSSQFSIVSTPVTYACENNQLRRYSGYGFQSAQQTPPSGGSMTVVATNVAQPCTMTYSALAQRVGLVTLGITLTDTGESVQLVHQMHLMNTP